MRGPGVCRCPRGLTAALLLLAALAPSACGGAHISSSPSPRAAVSSAPGVSGEGHGPVWTFQTGAPVRSTPAVAAEAVYVSSDDGNLYALDRATGHERWRLDIGRAVDWRSSRQPPSSPAVAGGVVYAGGNDGRLRAVDATTGRPLWELRTGAAIHSSPVVAGGLVYVGSDDGHLYAVDRTDGSVRWRFKPVVVLDCDTPMLWRPSPAEVRALPGEKVSSSPVVAGRSVFATDALGVVHALARDTGRWRWSYETGGLGSPAAAAGIVYHQSCALDAASGERLWCLGEGADPSSGVVDAPAITGGSAFYVGMTGRVDQAILVAVDARNGRLLWTFTTPGRVTDGMSVWFSPATAAGVVYFASHDGRLYAIDGRSGREQWSFRPAEPVSGTPAAAHGVVYFGSYDGRLYAVK